MISPIAKALVEQHDLYLSNLETAQGYLARETLTSEEMAGLTEVIRELQADKASPKFLLADQQKTLEDVFASVRKYASPQKPEQQYQEPVNLSFTLDLTSADNGAKKLPEEWFDHWANGSSGKAMASAGDFYQSWKQLKRSHESGNADEVRRVLELRSGFQDDFNWQGKQNYLVGGTRLEYQAESLDATIIQHYKARNSALVKKTNFEIPEYLGVSIVDVVKEQKGLHYLQVLLDTDDDAETIIETLEFVSAKQRSEIKIWTPPLKSGKYFTREQHPNRAAGFYFNNVIFHVDGNDINIQGRSRGVAEGVLPEGRAVKIEL